MTDETRTTLWLILSEAFQTILDALRATMPEVRMMAGHSHNDWFPFRAYAQYSKSEHVVVLSFDVHAKELQVHVSGDICLNDGTIIHDLMRTTADADSCDKQLLITHAVRFVLQCQQDIGLIASELDRAITENQDRKE
jgi:hypothetical protein